jgi:hypothetical protein
MPTRLLYEKITVSVTLAELTAEEERLFYRLLVKCDDHGRFHAHPAILLGQCLSLQASSITAEQVRAWRDRLEEAGLIRLYVVEGREYLVVLTWGAYQRQRASSSKYPDPPFRCQSRADARETQQMPPVPGTRGPEAGTRGPEPGTLREPPLAAAAPPTATSTIDVGHDELSDVPAPLTGFHSVLIGTHGYAPSPAFFEQVTDRYGSLDLREEALKMRAWLADPEQNRRHRSATENFILGWLKRELSSAPVPHRNGTASTTDDALASRMEQRAQMTPEMRLAAARQAKGLT